MKNKEIEELLNMLKKCAREDKATLRLNEIACKTILSCIEQLQTTANECKQDYQRMKENFDSKVDVIATLSEEKKQLENIRDKAIEYIANIICDEKARVRHDLCGKDIDGLINILKGDSDEK